MKFVCRKCETFMSFSAVEAVDGSSLGITFECPKCSAAIAMVTNAGETQMVQALGVSLGGREQEPSAFELTRSSLANAGQDGQEAAPAAPAAQDAVAASMGKCPFANSVASMAAKQASPNGLVTWTEGATTRLLNVPEQIRPVARQLIEGMARDLGRSVVDDDMMDVARDRFM